MQKNSIDPSQPSSPNLTSSLPAWPNALPMPPAPAVGDPALFPSHAAAPFDGRHHRRSASELPLRISEDLSSGNPTVTGRFEEIGSDDDLFSTFMDMEKIGCKMEDSLSGPEDGVCGDRAGNGNAGEGKAGEASRPKHLRSNSVEGSALSSSAAAAGREAVLGEMVEVKKFMTDEQIKKLAVVDPKRAKRILANRQSAARSKERKAHYISELERRARILQTEATTLSAQHTLYQRDIVCLTAENTELSLRLQAMEQQNQLRDVLDEALRQELDRLKLATGEPLRSGEANNAFLQQIPFNSSFVPIPQQQVSFSDSRPISDLTSRRRLDIGKGSARVKSESSSMLANEGNSNF